MSPATPEILRRRHIVLRLLAAGAAVAIMGVVLPRAVDYQRSRLAAQLATAARGADDATARAIVRQLDELGDCALDPLADLAGDGSTVAGAAAREAILDRFAAMTATEYLPTGSASSALPDVEVAPLAALADALAANAESFDSSTQPWASRLALRISRRCDLLSGEQAWTLARHCDRIVSVCQAEGQLATRNQPRLGANRDTREASSRPIIPPTNSATALIDLSPRFADAAESAGGSLSVVAPRRDAEEGKTWSAPAPQVPEQQPAAAAESNEAPRTAPPIVDVRPIPKPVDPNAVVVAPSPRNAQRRMLQLQSLSSRELESLRGTATGFEATAIREILQQRAAAIARLNPSAPGAPPKPIGRAGLEQLPELGAEQARELLRKLVRDEDPAIRLEAIAILATSADPQAAQILEERALRDADPRVADLATQILRRERK